MPIATKSSKLDISEESSTANLADKFSNFLKKGDILFLYGEIGVGKTTFVKYLVNSFQKNHNLPITEVTSPTFNIVNEYSIKNLTIQHYDLFRLKNTNETQNIGLFENLEEVIKLIEWPEKLKHKPKNLIELFFKYENKFKKRSLSINGNNKKNFNGLI